MTAADPIVIVSTARTPMGGFQGDFASVPAAHLGSAAIKAAVARADIAPEDVEEVAFGNVLSAGQGQAPARQAALGAGLPLSATCTTLNKMCGSGMKAAMYAHDMLSCRLCRSDRRGGHGKHVERAIPDAESARRAAYGACGNERSHVL